MLEKPYFNLFVSLPNARNHRNIYFIIVVVLIVTLANSCKSPEIHYKDFALQQQVREDYDSTKRQIFLCGTKPIDSIDPNRLIVDIYRIEIDKYPELLKVYARVYDSSGFFATNMAEPYIIDKRNKYWTRFDEKLGKVYSRHAEIDKFNVREYGAGDSIPYNIALTVDYSGSMTGVLSVISEGTELFVSMKQSYDKILLSSFTQEYKLQTPFSSDKDRIISLFRVKRAEQLNQGGSVFSAVNDALWNSMQAFEGTDDSVPRVLVVFTDGDDNYSKKALGELIDFARDKRIHIFAVAFGYSKDDNLRELARYTGGKFYKAYSKEELIAVFRDIYMSLRYYYYITYVPPKFWGYHQVKASINHPQRSDTIVAYGEYMTNSWLKPTDTIIRPIHFDFGKYEIKPESYVIIDEIVDMMMSHPKMKLEIQGHTDNVGSVEFNQTLSENRAKAVMDAIIAKGIEQRRLRSRGFGLSMPVTTNDTDEGRARNRRTEFHILAM
jgi:outer membrane protein OmpA-like peptidoglycan-associated protein